MLAVARRKLGNTADLRLEDASRMSFASRMFDLVSIVLVLHEMPAALRPAVLAECKRVVKADGRILLIDFNFGPYSVPAGWMWRLVRRFTELLAGREHFTNYCDFKKRGGLDPLIADGHLEVDKRFVTKVGTAAVFLLKP
jgi:ubiquinone/menaquinone biosynthesis C-methylase UbiE